MIYFICQGPLLRSARGTKSSPPQAGGRSYNYMPALAVMTGRLAASLLWSRHTEESLLGFSLGPRVPTLPCSIPIWPTSRPLIYLAVMLRFPVPGGTGCSPSGTGLDTWPLPSMLFSSSFGANFHLRVSGHHFGVHTAAESYGSLCYLVLQISCILLFLYFSLLSP